METTEEKMHDSYVNPQAPFLILSGSGWLWVSLLTVFNIKIGSMQNTFANQNPSYT